MKKKRNIFNDHTIIFLLIPIVMMLSFSLFGCKTESTNPTTTTTAAGTTTTTAAPATTTTTTTTTTAAPATTTTTTTTTTTLAFHISSLAFLDGSAIPTKYANTGVTGGQNTSISLTWSNAPSGTQYFAIAMIDTSASNYIHWFVINIPSTTSLLAEGASPSGMPSGCTELNNGYGDSKYGGPEPPQGDPDHNYVTTIYALNSQLSLSGTVTYAEFTNAVSGNLGTATITGTFSW